MSPLRIIEKAASLGLNMVAICDHNSAENVQAAANLGKRYGITVIPGMEITTSEEVHVLALFETAERACEMQSSVYEHLQPGVNDEDAFGMQVIVNEEDEVLGFNNRLLIGATDLPLNRVVDMVHAMHGLAIASHIDREGFGIIGQLGFIPMPTEFDALEISSQISHEEALERFSDYSAIPWIRSSDAHHLSDIGKASIGLLMNHSTFEELCLAIRGRDGRKVLI
jgi:PHP family Zn ribbon phosphoesterase